MTVSYERRDAVAVVTMNRPEYRNAQNSAMTYALDEAFTRAVNDSEVKVIVLAGAGDHFSAGHDIGSPQEKADQARRPYPSGIPGRGTILSSTHGSGRPLDPGRSAQGARLDLIEPEQRKRR